MHLAIYVHRQLGLTLGLAPDRSQPRTTAFRAGPAFHRLTADAGHLRDPATLPLWLAAFLPENGSLSPFRAHASETWRRHRCEPATPYHPASLLWGNADAEYTGGIDFVQAESTPPERLPDPAPPRYERLPSAPSGTASVQPI